MKEIINQKYLLHKMPEKGGWTYIVVKEIPKAEQKKHGMDKLEGTMDGHKLAKVSLMPMKNGNLFMPVNAEIRKAIGKEAGAWVDLVIYNVAKEEETLSAEETLLLCLEDEPTAKSNFENYTEVERAAFYTWIEASGSDEIKVNRIAKSIDLVLNKQKMK